MTRSKSDSFLPFCVIIGLLSFSLFLSSCSSKPEIPLVSNIRRIGGDSATAGAPQIELSGPVTAEKLTQVFDAINKNQDLKDLEPFIKDRKNAEHLAALYNIAFPSDREDVSRRFVQLLDQIDSRAGLELTSRLLAAFLASGAVEGSPQLLHSLLSKNNPLFDILRDLLKSPAMRQIAPFVLKEAIEKKESFATFAHQVGEFLTATDERGETGAQSLVNLIKELGMVPEATYKRGGEDVYQIAQRQGVSKLLAHFHKYSEKERNLLQNELFELVSTRSLSLFGSDSQTTPPDFETRQAIEGQHPANDLASFVKLAVFLNQPLGDLLDSLSTFLDAMHGYMTKERRLPPDRPAYAVVEAYPLIIDALRYEVRDPVFHDLRLPEKMTTYQENAEVWKNTIADYQDALFDIKEFEIRHDDDETCMAKMGIYLSPEGARSHCNSLKAVQKIYQDCLTRVKEITPITEKMCWRTSININSDYSKIKRDFEDEIRPPLTNAYQQKLLPYLEKVFTLCSAQGPQRDNLYDLFHDVFPQKESMSLALTQVLRSISEDSSSTTSPIADILSPTFFSHLPNLLRFNQPLDQFLRTTFFNRPVDTPRFPSGNISWIRYAIEDGVKSGIEKGRNYSVVIAVLESYQALDALIQRGSYEHLVRILAGLSNTLGDEELRYLINSLAALHSRMSDSPEGNTESHEPINKLSPILRKWLKPSPGDSLGKSFFSLLTAAGSPDLAPSFNQIVEELFLAHPKQRALEMFKNTFFWKRGRWPNEITEKEQFEAIEAYDPGIEDNLTSVSAVLSRVIGQNQIEEILSYLEQFRANLTAHKESRPISDFFDALQKLVDNHEKETETFLLALGSFLKNKRNVTEIIQMLDIYIKSLEETHPALAVSWWNVAAQLADQGVYHHIGEILLAVLERKDYFLSFKEGCQTFRELSDRGDLTKGIKFFLELAKASHKTRGVR